LKRKWSFLRRKDFSDDKFHTSKFGLEHCTLSAELLDNLNGKHLSFSLAKLSFSACVSPCPPFHAAMCSFRVLLQPIQASAAFETGSPVFGKLFLLCVSTDMWCARYRNRCGWKQLQGKKSSWSSFLWRVVAQKKKRQHVARQGGGTEQNDPILATAASTPPVIPYHPSFCYLRVLLADSLMCGNAQRFAGPATSCSALPCPQALAVRAASFAGECRVSVRIIASACFQVL